MTASTPTGTAALRHAFLETLLGPKPCPDAVVRVAVNRSPSDGDRRGRWSERAASDIEEVADHLAQHADDAETYTALAWSVGGKGAEHVVARRWLSADVDDKVMPGETAEERHRQARVLAGSLPCPSVVVDSGRGIHVHILLPEGEHLDASEDGRRHFAILGRALRIFLEQHAGELFGSTVSLDHCHGPERVWRVPGGWNCKSGEAAKTLTADRSAWCGVSLLHPGRPEGLASIAPAELMFLLPHLAAATQEQDGTEPGRNGSTAPPTGAGPARGAPPFDHHVLPPRLRDHWPLARMNPSEADYAVAFELGRKRTPREVAEAAIRCRRAAVGDPGAKGERIDYVARTVTRAYKAAGAHTDPAKTPGRPAPPPRQPFPLDALPPVVRRYVTEAAHCLGCCPSMIVLPVMVVLGAAIGTTRRLRLRGGSRPWRETPIFWGVIVAESGSLKSPALDQALDLIHRHESEAAKENEELRREYQRAMEIYNRDLLRFRRNKGEGSPPDQPERPAYRRHVVGDITIEALADRLQDNPRGLLVARDELSAWLKSFDAYRAGSRGGDAAKWLELHSGSRPLTVDRKTGDRATIHVEHAAASVIGGAQPRTLSRMLTPDFFDNGFTARLLLNMPPRMPRRWIEAEVSREALGGIERVLEHLLALKHAPGPDGDPVDLVFTPDGKAAWIQFFNEHAREGECLDGSLAAAWSKAEGYAARFALLVSLIQQAAGNATSAGGTIDAHAVHAGVALARWFAAEAERVYAVLRESPEESERRRLSDWVRGRGGQVTARDLARGPRTFRGNNAAAEQALQDLVDSGWGAWEEVPPSKRGGRPTRRFVLRGEPARGCEPACAAPEPDEPEPSQEGVDDPAPGAPEVHEYDFQGERRERGTL